MEVSKQQVSLLCKKNRNSLRARFSEVFEVGNYKTLCMQVDSYNVYSPKFWLYDKFFFLIPRYDINLYDVYVP